MIWWWSVITVLMYHRISADLSPFSPQFEADITKQPTPKKPKINQACTRWVENRSHRWQRVNHKHVVYIGDRETCIDSNEWLLDVESLHAQQKCWSLSCDGDMKRIWKILKSVPVELHTDTKLWHNWFGCCCFPLHHHYVITHTITNAFIFTIILLQTQN